MDSCSHSSMGDDGEAKEVEVTTESKQSVFITITKDSDEDAVSSDSKQCVLVSPTDDFSPSDLERAELLSKSSNSNNGSDWTDDSEDAEINVEEPYEIFVRKHCFATSYKKNKLNHDVSRSSAGSPTRRALSRGARVKRRCDSAPETPINSACSNSMEGEGLLKIPSTSNILSVFKSVPKDAVTRSKSLETRGRAATDKGQATGINDARHSFKRKLSRSASGLEKLSHLSPSINGASSDAASERRGRAYEYLGGYTNTKSTSPVLKFLKHGPKKQGKTTTKAAKDSKLNSVDRGGVTEGSVKRNSSPVALSSAPAAPAAGTLLLEDSIQPSSAISLGASSTVSDAATTGNDSVDGFLGVSEQQKNKQQAEQLRHKIIKTSELIKTEQATRDENVTEYLKLATSADKQQASRIKTVFEKKDQKSKANIQQLQKKLDSYHRKLKELDVSAKQGRLRDLRDFSGGVVDSVKGGLSGLQHATQNAAEAIVNKPKDLASRIKHRFGSTDNLLGLKDEETNSATCDDSPARSGSMDDISSTSGSFDNFNSPEAGLSVAASDSLNSAKTQRINAQQLKEVANQLLTIKSEMQELRKFQERMESEWEARKDNLQDSMTSMIEDEKVRNEDQFNDLTELHQREIASLKQDLASMEEKVEYHAHERARDMQEAMERCQTRIAKMELQQQRQQSGTVESFENATARALIGKLFNLLLSILAVLLVLVSTISGILAPFMKTQGRILFTTAVVIVTAIAYRNWSTLLSWYSAIAR